MPISLIDLASTRRGRHTWRAASPDVSTPWLQYLAERYRDLRTESTIPINRIQFDGLSFDVTAIRRRLTEAVLPDRSAGPLAVARSDFGETVSYCILAEKHSTRFGYKALRDREAINLPGRGIDAIGVEEANSGRLRLILGETKTSAEASSPPQVVDTAKDSLREQHLGHFADPHCTCSKVFDAARRAWDQRTQEMLFAAALFLEAHDWQRLDLVSFCCLVRQQNRYTENDYGSFKERPDDFGPCSIRFVIFCVPGDDIEKVVTEWLHLARSQEN